MRRGYSLLELSIVIVAIGIFAVLATGSLLPIAMKNKADNLNTALMEAVGFVESFARLNGRLPSQIEFEGRDNATFHEQVVIKYCINPNIADFEIPEYYLAYKPTYNDNITDASGATSCVSSGDVVQMRPREAEAVLGSRVEFAFYLDARYKNEKDDIYWLRHVGSYYRFIEIFGRRPTNAPYLLTDIIPDAKRGQLFRHTFRIRGGSVKFNNNNNLEKKFKYAAGIMSAAPGGWDTTSSKIYGYFSTPRSNYNYWINASVTFAHVENAFKNSGKYYPGVFTMQQSDYSGWEPRYNNNGLDPYTPGVISRREAAWQDLTCKANEPVCTFDIKSYLKIPRFGRFAFYRRNARADRPASGTSGPVGNRYVGEYFYMTVFLRDMNSSDPNKVYSRRYRINLYPLR